MVDVSFEECHSVEAPYIFTTIFSRRLIGVSLQRTEGKMFIRNNKTTDHNKNIKCSYNIYIPISRSRRRVVITSVSLIELWMNV